MQKEDTKTIIFAAIVCLVVSLLLSSTYAALKDLQAVNEENDRRKNVLKAFDVEAELADKEIDLKKISAEDIQGIFDQYIEEIFLDDNFEVIEGLSRENLAEFENGKYTPDLIEDKESAPHSLYLWVEDKTAEEREVKYYCYPQYGKGLWSTIYSYMALESNCHEIRGATFYGSKETPGLGLVCETDPYMEQFAGKRIKQDEEGEIMFDVVKGRVSDRFPNGNDYAVDGMSGATITGDGLERFIHEAFGKYNNYFQKVNQ